MGDACVMRRAPLFFQRPTSPPRQLIPRTALMTHHCLCLLSWLCVVENDMARHKRSTHVLWLRPSIVTGQLHRYPGPKLSSIQIVWARAERPIYLHPCCIPTAGPPRRPGPSILHRRRHYLLITAMAASVVWWGSTRPERPRESASAALAIAVRTRIAGRTASLNNSHRRRRPYRRGAARPNPTRGSTLSSFIFNSRPADRPIPLSYKLIRGRLRVPPALLRSPRRGLAASQRLHRVTDAACRLRSAWHVVVYHDDYPPPLGL